MDIVQTEIGLPFQGHLFLNLVIGQYPNQKTFEPYELLFLAFSMASGKSAYNIIIFGFILFIFRSIFIGFQIQQNVCASIKFTIQKPEKTTIFCLHLAFGFMYKHR